MGKELKNYEITFKNVLCEEIKDYFYARNKIEAKEKFIKKMGKLKIIKIKISNL